MIAFKPEKNPRRSSILKIPKNNPSQNGENAPSTENTPSKFKRRVSFAEKKHVKEFCHSNDQGTVWDNTYEESDSSQARNSLMASLDEGVQQSGCQGILRNPSLTNLDNVEPESYFPLLNHRPGEVTLALQDSNIRDFNAILDKENIPVIMGVEKVDSSLIGEDIIAVTQKLTENPPQRFSIYCDDDSEQNLEKNSENEKIESDVTVIEEQSMDCTLTVCESQISFENFDRKVNSLMDQLEKENSKRDGDPQQSEYISGVFDGIGMNEYIPPVACYNSQEKNGTLQLSQMEMTKAIPSVLSSLQNQIRNNTEIPHRNQEETGTLQLSRMEMTKAIPSILSNLQKQIPNNTEIPHRNQEETGTLQLSRMEMTKAIPSILSNLQKQIPNNTEIPHRNQEETGTLQLSRMEMTKAIPSILSNLQKQIPNNTEIPHRNQEETGTLQLSRMEMTKAIPSVLSNLQNQIQNNTEIFHRNEEETGTLQLNRMEMTKAIPSILSNHQNQIQNNNTEIFHGGRGMEFTACVSSNAKNNHQEETETLQLSRMEMTKAIPSILSNHQNQIRKNTEISHHNHQEETGTLQLSRMEMTKAIPSILSNLQNRTQNNTEIIHGNHEETATLQLSRMEMTKAIPSVLSNLQNQIQNNTEIFHRNQEETGTLQLSRMEMTKAIPSILSNQLVNRTQNFHQGGMEITQAIPSILHRQDNIDNQDRGLHKSRDDVTEGIPSIFNKQRNSSGQSRLLYQSGMEMTEGIPSILNKQDMNNGQIRELHESDMEMTLGISPVLSKQRLIDQSHVTNCLEMGTKQDRNIGNETQLFPQSRMELTEAIPSILTRHKNTNDETQMLQAGMELTESIPSLLHPQIPESNPETLNQTEITHNYFMELTEVVPSLKRNYNSISHQHKSGYSPLSSPHLKIQREKTSAFSTSKDDREALHRLLHTNSSNDEIIYPLSKNFANISMEMTTVVSPCFNSQENTKNQGNQVFENPINSSELVESNLPQRSEFIPSFLHQSIDVLNPDINPKKQIDKALPHIQPEDSTPGTDSSDSSKENQPPPDHKVRTMPVARGLFGNDENPESTAVFPLKDFHESNIDQVRHVLRNGVHDELTAPIQMINPGDFFSNGKEDDTTRLVPIIPQIPLTFDDDLHDNQLEDVGSKQTKENHGFSESYTDLNDIEEPSFIFSDSIEVPEVSLTKNITQNSNNSMNERDTTLTRNEIENEKEDIVGIPEISSNEENTKNQQTSRSENVIRRTEEREMVEVPRVSPIENITQNQQISRMESITTITTNEEEELISKRSKSGTCTKIENIRRTTIIIDKKDKISSNIRVTERILPEDFRKDRILKSAGNYLSKKRRSCHDSSEEDITLERKKHCRSSNYIVEQTDGEIRTEFDIRESEIGSRRVDLQEAIEMNDVENLDHNKDEEKDNSTPAFQDKSVSINSVGDNTRKDIFSYAEYVIFEHDLVIQRVRMNMKKREAIKKKLEESRQKNDVNKKRVGQSECTNSGENSVDNDILKSPYEILKDRMESFAKTRECIWKIYHIDPRKIVVEYCKTGLIFGIVFDVPDNPDEIERIIRVRVFPRCGEEEKPILRMTDRLIVQQLDTDELQKNFKTYDDVMQLLQVVTEQVNFVFDFYHDLKKLKIRNLMGISEDRVWFISRTKKMDIILKVWVNIKPFLNIGPEDIEVECLLGEVKKNDIKILVKNIKKSYRFLTLYMNDVSSFIELMEESLASKKKMSKIS